MTDRGAVTLAAAAVLGALLARPLPWWALVLAACSALAVPHRGVRAMARLGLVVALASVLGARAVDGLTPPPGGEVQGWATLVTDPAERSGATHVEVRFDGKRYDTWARGAGAGTLRALAAGDAIELRGRRAPLIEPWRTRLASRHLVARLSLTEITDTRSATGPAGVANAFRAVLVRGASALPDDQRPLFGGFVLGDDRGQDTATIDDFRSSGLSHLLVVSGQNVAFVLALTAPLVRRGPRWWRVGWGVFILLGFGLLTRWEPSVLRAVGMAGVALLATSAARPASTVRLLALTVAGLVLVDPLLVHSIGFRLSVGASGGIALLSGRMAKRLPSALAVTLAAQAGVAPILMTTFGGIPVVAPIANLLAAPAAAPTVVWGAPASLATALGVPGVVQLPTRLLVGWVAFVARVAAGAPFGRLEAAHLLGLAAIALLFVRTGGRARLALGVATALVLMHPLMSALVARGHDEVAPGTQLWRGHGSIVLVTDGSSVTLLSDLRARGVGRIDVLIATRGGRRVADAVLPVMARIPVGTVIAPRGSQLPRTRSPDVRFTIRTAAVDLTVTPTDSRLDVSIHRADAVP